MLLKNYKFKTSEFDIPCDYIENILMQKDLIAKEIKANPQKTYIIKASLENKEEQEFIESLDFVIFQRRQNCLIYIRNNPYLLI